MSNRFIDKQKISGTVCKRNRIFSGQLSIGVGYIDELID